MPGRAPIPEDAALLEGLDAAVEADALGLDEAAEKGALTYAPVRKDDEQRYTLGPLYAPDRKDAHGE